MSALVQKTTAVSRMVGELRQLSGLKNVDLANIVGVSPPTVHRWSKGQGSPTIEKQQVIAELRWAPIRLLGEACFPGVLHQFGWRSAVPSRTG